MTFGIFKIFRVAKHNKYYILKGNCMAENKKLSVVTVPLKTEKWQEDILHKRFELCRKIYNNMLHYEIKQLNKALHDKRYIDAKKTINEVYKISDDKEKRARKQSEDYKQAVKVSNEVLKEYGLTEFGFIAESLRQREIYKTNISSITAQLSIGKPLWSAMQKYLFGNGKKLHYKKYGSWGSMASNGKSGIRMVDKDGKTLFCRERNQAVWINMSVPKGKSLLMPVMIDEKDLYKIEMLSRKIKVVRIIRKLCGSKYKYFVQLTVEGSPALKYDNNGNEKNPVGKGKVGIYIDTTSVTLALEDGNIKNISLQYNNDSSEKIVNIQKYMDNSRRAMNPDNYNEDGTVKKGIIEDGTRRKLYWNESNGYKRAKLELKNLFRIEAEKRALERHIIANEILSYGNEFIVNNYLFQYAAMRKKVFNENTGQEEKRKKAGAAVGNNAPATLVSLIEAKSGIHVVEVDLKDVDYSLQNYREYYARKLLEQIL